LSLADSRGVARTGQLRRRLRVQATPFLLLLPAMALLGAVAAYPLVGALRISLLQFRLNAPERFVGLDARREQEILDEALEAFGVSVRRHQELLLLRLREVHIPA